MKIHHVRDAETHARDAMPMLPFDDLQELAEKCKRGQFAEAYLIVVGPDMDGNVSVDEVEGPEFEWYLSEYEDNLDGYFLMKSRQQLEHAFIFAEGEMCKEVHALAGKMIGQIHRKQRAPLRDEFEGQPMLPFVPDTRENGLQLDLLSWEA